MTEIIMRVRIVPVDAEAKAVVKNLEDRKDVVVKDAAELDKKVEKASIEITKQQMKVGVALMLAGKIGSMVRRLGKATGNIWVEFAGSMISSTVSSILQFKIMATALTAAGNPFAGAILFASAGMMAIENVSMMASQIETHMAINAAMEEIA